MGYHTHRNVEPPCYTSRIFRHFVITIFSQAESMNQFLTTSIDRGGIKTEESALKLQVLFKRHVLIYGCMLGDTGYNITDALGFFSQIIPHNCDFTGSRQKICSQNINQS
ncbi:hypothetical protein D3C76_1201480 [compost metagenome]